MKKRNQAMYSAQGNKTKSFMSGKKDKKKKNHWKKKAFRNSLQSSSYLVKLISKL
jgi:hypothetical protein